MESRDVRAKFIEFFNTRGHAVIPSSSLVPQGDVTTLFTGSGMQPLIKYLLGEKHPGGVQLVNSQKCFRAEDIDEVGDNRHTTFFEMLGNWSLGDYFKERQLPWFWEFLTEIVGLDPKKLYVTVFAGDDENGIPRDKDSADIWKRLFAKKKIPANTADMITVEQSGERGMKEGERIFYYGSQKNWWSRAGIPAKMPAREPGGPDSEVFYDFGTPHDPTFGAHCHPNCDCGRFMEIGNSVFIEYRKTETGTFEKLSQRNVDFGGGLERITAASQDNPDIFAIDLLAPLISAMPTAPTDMRRKRIIADHLRSAAFLINDGVMPSNKDRGYIVRKLIRRAVVHTDTFRAESFRGADTLSQGLEGDLEEIYKAIAVVAENYKGIYDLDVKKITDVFHDEVKQFRSAFRTGMRELKRYETIDTAIAFKLYESFGLPYEVIKEFAGEKARGLTREEFERKLEEHRGISRAGAEKKFGGHGLLLNTGELKAKDEAELKKVTRLHTATHLLHKALRETLGEGVHQAGSDITAERTRFDFTFGRKLTAEEVVAVETRVNEKIREDLPVGFVELPKAEAEKTGALFFFREKYPDRVKVYFTGDSMENAYSKEFCGGPHVTHTGEIGTFKIIKEESSSAGVRRIRATVA